MARQGRPHLRLVTSRPLRVADVALFYGERSGGIRTYLDAKVEHAVRTGAFEHHLIVPGVRAGRREHAAGAVHELPAVRVGGVQRLPLAARLASPDHAAATSSRPTCCCCTTRSGRRAPVQARVPSSWSTTARVALDAAALRGPQKLYAAGFGAWLRRAYAHADGVMAACDPHADTGRDATLPLRFGLDPAFGPRGSARAATTSSTPAGSAARRACSRCSRRPALGGAVAAVAHGRRAGRARARRARSRRLGLRDRVRFLPAPERTATRWPRAYQRARCVVMPGELETFGLVAYEAVGERRVDGGVLDARRPRGCSATSCARSRPATSTGWPGAIARRPRERARPRRRADVRRAPPVGRRVQGRAGGPRAAGERHAVTALARERPVAARSTHGALAVALHDVQPATFERCALIRDWLYDLGVETRDAARHPRARAAPVLPALARARRLAARPPRRRRRDRAARAPAPPHAAAASAARPVRDFQGGAATEFPGLDEDATVASRRRRPARARDRRRCRRAGSSRPATPTPARCASTSRRRFDWWATLFGVAAALARSPPRCASAPRPRSSARPRRRSLRAAAALSGRLLRLDLHPADFEHPSHVHAVEAVLRRAHDAHRGHV